MTSKEHNLTSLIVLTLIAESYTMVFEKPSALRIG